VCAAEPHEGISGVAKAEQRAADFEIEIRVRRTGRTGLPQVEDEGQEDSKENDSAADEDARACNPGRRRIVLVPEKPGDLARTTHAIPQMPKKTGNNLGMQVRDLILLKI